MTGDQPRTATKTGLTLAAGLEGCVQKTVAALISDVGDSRISGVRCISVRGRSEVLAWLHRIWSPNVHVFNGVPEETVAAFRDQARALIREHGDQVVVVVAQCQVREP